MITWIIESGVFADNDLRLTEAAKTQGHEIILWDDEWTRYSSFPTPVNNFTLFHGSLGNASLIVNLTNWKPGAFCTTENFHCSAWYPQCRDWLLHKKWVKTTVAEFINNPELYFGQMGTSGSVFIRPDSPLKPFSGRVIHKKNLSMKSLDYCYYYEDENLPIIIAPVSIIDNEWRFVVVRKKVVAGSAYIAESRNEAGCITAGTAWDYARFIANNVIPPDDVYVLDICKSEGEYRLLELNPFSGADLYACDRLSILNSISLLVVQTA